MTAEPLTSIDGALTAQENTALLAEIPSHSTPAESAKLRVVDAGFTREQVSSLSCSVDVEPSSACFPARAAVSPVTSPMLMAAVEAAAIVSLSNTLMPFTTSCPEMVQFPFTVSLFCTIAPPAASSDRTYVVPHRKFIPISCSNLKWRADMLF